MPDAIIWDLDHTLYRLCDRLKDLWNRAYANYFASLALGYTAEEALEIATRSYRETGYSAHWFLRQHALCPRETHLGVHRYMEAEHLPVCMDTQEAFAARPCLKHGLVTHGSRDWALRALDRLGLAGFFGSAAIVSLEDAGYVRKSEGAEGLVRCLEALGTAPAHALFVEDTAANLPPAKRLGLSTCLVTQGRPAPRNTHGAIDWVRVDARDVLQSLS